MAVFPPVEGLQALIIVVVEDIDNVPLLSVLLQTVTSHTTEILYTLTEADINVVFSVFKEKSFSIE